MARPRTTDGPAFFAIPLREFRVPTADVPLWEERLARKKHYPGCETMLFERVERGPETDGWTLLTVWYRPVRIGHHKSKFGQKDKGIILGRGPVTSS